MLCCAMLPYTTLQYIPLNLSQVRKKAPTADAQPWWALSHLHMSYWACRYGQGSGGSKAHCAGVVARDAARPEPRWAGHGGVGNWANHKLGEQARLSWGGKP